MGCRMLATDIDCIFSDVVVGFEAGVGCKARQRGAAFEDVAQRLGELRSSRELSLGCLCPGEERIEQGNDSGTMREPLVWRSEARLILNGIELGDPIER